MSTNRRQLLQATAALGLGSAVAAPTIPKRTLGATSLQVSIMGLGGLEPWKGMDVRQDTEYRAD